MDWKEYFVWFFKSFNPRAYGFLTDRFTKETWKYWVWMFVFSFIIMLILFLPILFTISGDLQSKANQIDDFYLEGHISLSKPLMIMQDPLVVMDFNRTYPMNEKMLITKESLFFKKYYWFGDTRVVFSDVKNLRSPEAVGLITFIALLIIPSLLLLVLLFYFIKNTLVVLIIASIGWGISHLFKYKISFSKSLKVALFAGTLLVFLELILFPFWRSFWLPFVIFLAYYGMGVVRVGEEKYESRPF